MARSRLRVTGSRRPSRPRSPMSATRLRRATQRRRTTRRSPSPSRETATGSSLRRASLTWRLISRAPFGGINKSIVNVQVMDYKPNSPLQGAVVTIDNGPDPMRTDLTDANGLASFAAMTPTGPTEYYDLSASLGGYETLPVDLPPAPVAHLQVAPSQTAPTSQIRIFKPGTINVRVESSPGVLYTGYGDGAGDLVDAAQRQHEHVHDEHRPRHRDAVAGQKVVPGVSYTIKALTTTPLCAHAVRTDLEQLPRRRDDDGDARARRVPVRLADGQRAAARHGRPRRDGPSHRRPEQHHGLAGPDDRRQRQRHVQQRPGRDRATRSPPTRGTTREHDASVTVAGPNNATVTLPNPPTGTLTVNVSSWQSPASGATVTLTGGPSTSLRAPPRDGSGQVVFTNVPTGSGYTVTATRALPPARARR